MIQKPKIQKPIALKMHQRMHQHLRMAQQKAKRDGLTKLPDNVQRDRLYQNYLQKLDLDSLDRADLVSRGLSDGEIKHLAAKSTRLWKYVFHCGSKATSSCIENFSGAGFKSISVPILLWTFK